MKRLKAFTTVKNCIDPYKIREIVKDQPYMHNKTSLIPVPIIPDLESVTYPDKEKPKDNRSEEEG